MSKTIEISVYDLEQLEKENKSLKEQIEKRQEEVERFKNNAMADMDEITKLEEENKNLKEKIQTLELWLDNKEALNEEYRKHIDKLKGRGQDVTTL